MRSQAAMQTDFIIAANVGPNAERKSPNRLGILPRPGTGSALYLSEGENANDFK
jgi:hypothetical protein